MSRAARGVYVLYMHMCPTTELAQAEHRSILSGENYFKAGLISVPAKPSVFFERQRQNNKIAAPATPASAMPTTAPVEVPDLPLGWCTSALVHVDSAMDGRVNAAEVPDCRMRSPLAATPQLNDPKSGCVLAMQYSHCVVPVDVPEHSDVEMTPDDG